MRTVAPLGIRGLLEDNPDQVASEHEDRGAETMTHGLITEQRQKIKAAEAKWQEGAIERLVEHDKHWEITFGAGSFYLDKSHGHIPSLGQKVRIYEGGPHGRINGVDLDGAEVFYRSPAEDEAAWAELARREAARVRESNPDADVDFRGEGLPFADAFSLAAEEEANRRQRA